MHAVGIGDAVRRFEGSAADHAGKLQRIRFGSTPRPPCKGHRAMGVTRNMRGHRQPVANTMALGLSEDGLVARAQRDVATHTVPEKAGPDSLARQVYRIRWPQPVLTEPIGPITRIIVHSHAIVGSGEKIPKTN